jgi:hypothetical protein
MGGAVAGPVDVFSLTGTSPTFPSNTLPRPGDNFALIDLRAVGIRHISIAGTDIIQFAVTTWGDRSHPNYPAEFDVYIDVNRDGIDDYVASNTENTGFALTGQNVTTLTNIATNATVTRFFTTADLSSANAILSIQLSDVAGLTLDQPFRFGVFAVDNYFTGAFTDAIVDMTYTLNTPRFTAMGPPPVMPNTNVNLTVSHDPSGDAASPSQSGLFLLYQHAKKGREADLISVTP